MTGEMLIGGILVVIIIFCVICFFASQWLAPYGGE